MAETFPITPDKLPTPDRVDVACALDGIADVALEAGRKLMESEAAASSVEELVGIVARGLGAERVELRIGYASLAVTLGSGETSITRIRRAGRTGVNMRLEEALWHLAHRVSRHELTAQQASAELAVVAASAPRYPTLVVGAAVGLACSAFARLLEVDWPGAAAVFLASGAGQCLRRGLHSCRLNPFLSVALVSFVTSAMCLLAGRWAGSVTVTRAMVASVLLLIPGVPALSAQDDILHGFPTLGSARAVVVLMVLVFMTAGLWSAALLLRL